MKKSVTMSFGRKTFTLLCVLFIALSSFNMPIKAKAATQLRESDILNYLNGKNGKKESSYGGLCLKWAFTQFKNMGASDAKAGLSCCCAHYCGTHMAGRTADSSNIPIGAIVFFDGPSSQGTCSSCKQHYGHAGIYIGNGNVSSIHGNGTIKSENISSWNSWGYRYMCWAIPKNVEIIRNITAPIAVPNVSDVRVENVTWRGYDVSCIVTNDSNLGKVEFPTWTDRNGQDDIKWYSASKINGRWKYHVSISDHNNESGIYYTHCYSWATNGQYGNIGTTSVNVPARDVTPPSITDIKIENVNAYGYDISCKVTDNTNVRTVQFKTWSNNNGQLQTVVTSSKKENGRYYAHIDIADHHMVRGAYTTCVYAWDSQDNSSVKYSNSVTIPEPTTAVTAVSIDKTEVELKVGEMVTLTASLSPENATDKSVKWESSDPQIAVVENGLVKAVSAGEAKIIVSSISNPEISNICKIRVVNNITEANKVETSNLVGKEFENGNFKYEITDNGEVTINGYTAVGRSTIAIPDVIYEANTEYKVTSIADNAFKGNKNLKKVTIGSAIARIGKNAFSGCSNLKKIKIETTLLTKKTVGKNAFKGINTNAKVVVPKNKFKTYSKILKAKGVKGKNRRITK